MTQANFEQMFPLGDTNDAFAAYFAGQSYLAPLTGGSVPVANVSFEPGCRNNWHIHHGRDGGCDQILICTAGSGWYQAEGEEPVSMCQARSCASRRTRSTGTARKLIRGSHIWHSSRLAPTPVMSGLSRSRATNTTLFSQLAKAPDSLNRNRRTRHH